MFNHWGITPTEKLAQDITFWRQNRFPAPILLLARGCDCSPYGDLMPPSLFPPTELQEGSVGPHSYFFRQDVYRLSQDMAQHYGHPGLSANQTPSAQFAGLSEISWVAKAMLTRSGLYMYNVYVNIV